MQAGGEGEPLLPAAGELARQLLAPVLEAEPLEAAPDGAGAVGDPVDPRDEVEVLADAQVRRSS
jgi:hypothetical protein